MYSLAIHRSFFYLAVNNHQGIRVYAYYLTVYKNKPADSMTIII